MKSMKGKNIYKQLYQEAKGHGKSEMKKAMQPAMKSSLYGGGYPKPAAPGSRPPSKGPVGPLGMNCSYRG